LDSQKLDDMFAALKKQAANAAVKQITRSDVVTFLLSGHTITEGKAIDRAEPGRWIFQPGHFTWRAHA